MKQSAFEALSSYIEQTSFNSGSTGGSNENLAHALAEALDHAEEYSLPAPDVATGQLLATLAAASTRNSHDKPQAIAITPAASVAGLYLLSGLPDSGILSCIDPEAEHQASAKKVFRLAGYKPAHVRFLPAMPLDVMGRLASESYQIIFADVPVLDILAVTKAALPLLCPGGTLVLAGTLLDGTLADSSRTDRLTNAAREFDAYALELADATVTRLPLGSGLTLITKA